MHAIAKKTEQEMVSIRFITAVISFFLPATFFAAFFLLGLFYRCNTKLNELQAVIRADVLDFEHEHRKLQTNALHIYLPIAPPLIASYFLVGGYSTMWSRRSCEGTSCLIVDCACCCSSSRRDALWSWFAHTTLFECSLGSWLCQ